VTKIVIASGPMIAARLARRRRWPSRWTARSTSSRPGKERNRRFSIRGSSGRAGHPTAAPSPWWPRARGRSLRKGTSPSSGRKDTEFSDPSKAAISRCISRRQPATFSKSKGERRVRSAVWSWVTSPIERDVDTRIGFQGCRTLNISLQRKASKRGSRANRANSQCAGSFPLPSFHLRTVVAELLLQAGGA
jgi:hypothetical protein